MRQVWSDENRTQKYLDIEAALAKVQGGLGLIPQEAADEIVSHCRLDQIDMAKLRQQTERIGYPILGVVSQLNALCRDKLGEYCHWGATTQDITDTATVLQIREGLALVDAELAAISAALARLAQRAPRHPDDRPQQPAAGDPVTFGYKMAGLLSAIERHRERLAQLQTRVLVGRVRRRRRHAGVARERRDGNAGRPDAPSSASRSRVIAWHTIRDNIAEVGTFLGLVGGTLGKLSMDVKLMMQTEVGEVYEPFAHGRGSSSTMPQKRNPISQLLHPRRDLGGAPARRRADGRDGRRPRALDRPVGDRMDRAARGVLPDGRRAEAVALRARGAGGRRRGACAATST